MKTLDSSRFAPVAALALSGALIAACSTTKLPDAPKTITRGPTVKANPHYKVGAPYEIDGRWYVPKVEEAYVETGVASWYGDAFHGKLTANGEIFDKRRLSAAHRTLPMPTVAEVENLENGRKIVVRVNDRGPFARDRIIDLSHAAADALGFTQQGTAKVRVRYVGETDVNGFAALPNAAPTQVAAAHVAKALPVRTPPVKAGPAVTPTPAAADDDPLGALIASAAGAAPFAPDPAPVMTAQAAPAPAELWVEVAEIGDLSALEGMRFNIDNAGPMEVRSAEKSGRPVQIVRLGPFFDSALANASLSKVRAAGYSAAKIVSGAGR